MVNQIHTEDLCFTLFRDAKKNFLILAMQGWSAKILIDTYTLEVCGFSTEIYHLVM